MKPYSVKLYLGIDPNMDDPSKVHAHSVVPTKMEDWPSIDEIRTYRDRVRARLHGVYETRLVEGKMDRRLARVMGMARQSPIVTWSSVSFSTPTGLRA